MSKDTILSSASGVTVSLMASAYTSIISSALEVFIVGMVGGIGGILGKMLVQFIVKKIKNYQSKKQLKNEKH